MFSYPDAARYRLGPNYQQLPCNRPISKVYSPYQRDGPGTINGNYGRYAIQSYSITSEKFLYESTFCKKRTNTASDPDYVGSSFVKLRHGSHELATHEEWLGKVMSHSSEVTDRDFEQSRALWQIMLKEEGGRESFLKNLCPNLGKADQRIIDEAISKW